MQASNVHFQYTNLGVQQEEALKKAEAYAEQALRLDAESAQAHMVLGAVSGTRGNQREAVKHLKQALSINPNDWDATLWLLTVYYISGKASAAWSLADRLMEIDPLNPWAPFARAVIYIQCEGRFDLAAELLQRNRELLDLPFFRSYVAYALAGARRYKDALVLLEPIEPTSNQDAFSVQACLFVRLALQGGKEKVRKVISSEYLATCRRDAAYSLITADLSCDARRTGAGARLAGKRGESRLHQLPLPE